MNLCPFLVFPLPVCFYVSLPASVACLFLFPFPFLFPCLFLFLFVFVFVFLFLFLFLSLALSLSLPLFVFPFMFLNLFLSLLLFRLLLLFHFTLILVSSPRCRKDFSNTAWLPINPNSESSHGSMLIYAIPSKPHIEFTIIDARRSPCVDILNAAPSSAIVETIWWCIRIWDYCYTTYHSRSSNGTQRIGYKYRPTN